MCGHFITGEHLTLKTNGAMETGYLIYVPGLSWTTRTCHWPGMVTNHSSKISRDDNFIRLWQNLAVVVVVNRIGYACGWSFLNATFMHLPGHIFVVAGLPALI